MALSPSITPLKLLVVPSTSDSHHGSLSSHFTSQAAAYAKHSDSHHDSLSSHFTSQAAACANHY
eukprot:783478-Amphidinium_carterae.2